MHSRRLAGILAAAWLLLGLTGSALAQNETADTESARQGRLWQVSGPGIEPSYLFGTMHSEDPAVTRLPDEVQRVFGQADRLVLEMVMDEAAMLAIAQAGLFETNRDLKDVLPVQLYRRTVEAMTNYGVPESVLRRHKPWMVFSTLMLPTPRTGLFLDMKLYQQASGRKIPVSGLETAAEQIAVFEQMSMPDQVAILKDTLDHLDTLDEYFARMRRIYLSGDLDALARFSDSMMEDIDPGLVGRFNQRFITTRNHRMTERMKQYLEQGNAFIAIGALHLPGEEGVLNLLQEAGYRVRSVE